MHDRSAETDNKQEEMREILKSDDPASQIPKSRKLKLDGQIAELGGPI
jgi:hypothetical protein